jgi:hypothetical protein
MLGLRVFGTKGEKNAQQSQLENVAHNLSHCIEGRQGNLQTAAAA